MGTQDGFLGKSKGQTPAYDDDHFGGIGITIGTNIGPEERLRLAHGPDYDASKPHNPYGDTPLSEVLRKQRTNLGLSLDEVAEITRVKRAYLEAFELETYDVLPPRAFSVGYVKSYAKALGLDEETMAEMFKRDFVDPHVSLRPPVGASFEDVRPQYGPYIGGAMVLVLVVAIWNVLQWNPDLLGHKSDEHASLESQPWTPGAPIVRDGVVYVSKPAAAPKDQDVPDAYVTPGLEEQFAALALEKRRNDQVVDAPVTGLVRKAFTPKGAIYGAQPEASLVTIQATRSVNLVVRTPQSIIYLARQLSAGEAYRVPQATKEAILIDVSDNTAMEVYYNGELAGTLDAVITPVNQLNTKAANWAKALDAQEGAQLKARQTLQASAAEAQAASVSSQAQSQNASQATPAQAAPQTQPQTSSRRDTPLPYIPKTQTKPAQAKPVTGNN